MNRKMFDKQMAKIRAGLLADGGLPRSDAETYIAQARWRDYENFDRIVKRAELQLTKLPEPTDTDDSEITDDMWFRVEWEIGLMTESTKIQDRLLEIYKYILDFHKDKDVASKDTLICLCKQAQKLNEVLQKLGDMVQELGKESDKADNFAFLALRAALFPVESGKKIEKNLKALSEAKEKLEEAFGTLAD